MRHGCHGPCRTCPRNARGESTTCGQLLDTRQRERDTGRVGQLDRAGPAGGGGSWGAAARAMRAALAPSIILKRPLDKSWLSPERNMAGASVGSWQGAEAVGAGRAWRRAGGTVPCQGGRGRCHEHLGAARVDGGHAGSSAGLHYCLQSLHGSWESRTAPKRPTHYDNLLFGT